MAAPFVCNPAAIELLVGEIAATVIKLIAATTALWVSLSELWTFLRGSRQAFGGAV